VLVNASSAWPLRWPAESEGGSEPYTVLIEQQSQQVPEERPETLASLGTEMLPGLERQRIGFVFDPEPGSEALGGRPLQVIQPPLLLKRRDGLMPDLVRPARAAARPVLPRHRHQQRRRLTGGEPCREHNTDMPIASMLAQQIETVPQSEMGLTWPRQRRVRGEHEVGAAFV
jgi:hypothetical protein